LSATSSALEEARCFTARRLRVRDNQLGLPAPTIFTKPSAEPVIWRGIRLKPSKLLTAFSGASEERKPLSDEFRGHRQSSDPLVDEIDTGSLTNHFPQSCCVPVSEPELLWLENAAPRIDERNSFALKDKTWI
jgi:hypothetical protein